MEMPTCSPEPEEVQRRGEGVKRKDGLKPGGQAEGIECQQAQEPPKARTSILGPGSEHLVRGAARVGKL